MKLSISTPCYLAKASGLAGCLLLWASLARAQAPTVTGLEPLRNAIAVPCVTPIRITFDQPLSTNRVTQQALRLFSQQAGGQRTGTVSVNANTLTIKPNEIFQPGETVFATLTTAVQNSGENQHLLTPQVFQFTTATVPSLGTFSGGSDLAAGLDPTSVAVGDVDGDGDLDLLTANSLSNLPGASTVSVRRNDGHGSFAGSQEVVVGRSPYQVVLADVDGDGDLDLLSANSADPAEQVSVRLNNGRGDFNSGYRLIGDGNSPHGLAVGDVNGDGRLDLLVAFYIDDKSSLGSTVSVFLNTGSGFSLGQGVVVGARPLNVVLGDLDGDGDLDFVTASSNNTTASVRLNDGTGHFSGVQEVSVNFNPQLVALGDVDGDGDLDFVTANYHDYTSPHGGNTSSTASVRLNDGHGKFGGTQEVILGDGARSVVLGDVDGDGDLDLLATGEISNTVSVRYNDGRGIFRSGQEVGVAQGAYGLALGDVDGDGKLDLVTSNGLSSTISVRLNLDRMLATTPLPTSEEMSVYPNPSAGDFTVSYLGSQSQTALLTLADVLGRLVLQQRVAVQAGSNQVPVVLANFQPGLYHLTLRLADGQRLSQKVSLGL